MIWTVVLRLRFWYAYLYDALDHKVVSGKSLPYAIRTSCEAA